jgi:flagellar biogenesis protein FliO
MSIESILTSSFALIFVLSLIGIISIFYRKYVQGIEFSSNKDKPKKRIKVIETSTLDAKRKIVLIAKDEKEFLVAFNENSIEILDSENKKN